MELTQTQISEILSDYTSSSAGFVSLQKIKSGKLMLKRELAAFYFLYLLNLGVIYRLGYWRRNTLVPPYNSPSSLPSWRWGITGIYISRQAMC